MSIDIRPMSTADVAPAAAIVSAGGWPDRTEFFRFAVVAEACRPFIARADGGIVGTGVGTANGAAGWLGAVYVAPDRRRRGLGVALTMAVIDALEAAGCRTIVLVASEQGLPLYRRLGFEIQSTYRTIEAVGLPDPGPPHGVGADSTIRPFRPDDLDSMARLDAWATAEDRRHLLAGFATPESAHCLVSPAGDVRGFVVRAPWGGGATIVPDPDDAVGLLDARRRAAGPDRRVRAGVLDENAEGLRRLAALGWADAWRAPRLVRGAPLDWHPAAIWGQFNHAVG